MLVVLAILIVLGFVGHRVTTERERAQLLRAVVTRARRLKESATRNHREGAPYREALKLRARWAFVTPALIALNAVVFSAMLFGKGSLGDPQTIVAWGGNVGPDTTNGEWWRLVTANVVHAGAIQLLASTLGLLQLGLLVERLIGPVAFVATYVTAGVFAGVVSVSLYPVAVHTGASGAIFGLYGVLVVSWIWQTVHRSETTVPAAVLKSLAPSAVVFTVFSAASGALPIASEIAGFAVGLASGLVLVVDVAAHRAPIARIVSALAIASVVVLASAATLRGITDIRPELQRVVLVEESTAGLYRSAADGLAKNQKPHALADLIDRQILPELEAMEERLGSLPRVPGEHQPFIATAEEFLRLRHASWVLRAEGLRRIGTPVVRKDTRTERESDASVRVRAEAQHRGNMLMLAKAETAERISLETLKRIR